MKAPKHEMTEIEAKKEEERFIARDFLDLFLFAQILIQLSREGKTRHIYPNRL
jgi:hypothetical protein